MLGIGRAPVENVAEVLDELEQGEEGEKHVGGVGEEVESWWEEAERER